MKKVVPVQITVRAVVALCWCEIKEQFKTNISVCHYAEQLARIFHYTVTQ